MIARPPGLRGAAFTSISEGDMRADLDARALVADRLGLSRSWATVEQVHGRDAIAVEGPGSAGQADALFTMAPGVPVAVFTADCAGIVIEAENGVGVAHAGWRGLAAGVIGALRDAMAASGCPPTRAAIGPMAGPCCYEVGGEVIDALGVVETRTTWGTPSVDLRGVAEAQLEGLDVFGAALCTIHDLGQLSHRRNQTPSRMAAVGWL